MMSTFPIWDYTPVALCKLGCCEWGNPFRVSMDPGSTRQRSSGFIAKRYWESRSSGYVDLALSVVWHS